MTVISKPLRCAGLTSRTQKSVSSSHLSHKATACPFLSSCICRAAQVSGQSPALPVFRQGHGQAQGPLQGDHSLAPLCPFLLTMQGPSIIIWHLLQILIKPTLDSPLSLAPPPLPAVLGPALPLLPVRSRPTVWRRSSSVPVALRLTSVASLWLAASATCTPSPRCWGSTPTRHTQGPWTRTTAQGEVGSLFEETRRGHRDGWSAMIACSYNRLTTVT